MNQDDGSDQDDRAQQLAENRAQGAWWEAVNEAGILRHVHTAQEQVVDGGRRYDAVIGGKGGEALALVEVKSGEISDPKQLIDQIDGAIRMGASTYIIAHPDPEKVLQALERFPQVLEHAAASGLNFIIKDLSVVPYPAETTADNKGDRDRNPEASVTHTDDTQGTRNDNKQEPRDDSKPETRDDNKQEIRDDSKQDTRDDNKQEAHDDRKQDTRDDGSSERREDREEVREDTKHPERTEDERADARAAEAERVSEEQAASEKTNDQTPADQSDETKDTRHEDEKNERVEEMAQDSEQRSESDAAPDTGASSGSGRNDEETTDPGASGQATSPADEPETVIEDLTSAVSADGTPPSSAQTDATAEGQDGSATEAGEATGLFADALDVVAEAEALAEVLVEIDMLAPATDKEDDAARDNTSGDDASEGAGGGI
jgi:hypothetical protein